MGKSSGTGVGVQGAHTKSASPSSSRTGVSEMESVAPGLGLVYTSLESSTITSSADENIGKKSPKSPRIQRGASPSVASAAPAKSNVCIERLLGLISQLGEEATPSREDVMGISNEARALSGQQV